MPISVPCHGLRRSLGLHHFDTGWLVQAAIPRGSASERARSCPHGCDGEMLEVPLWVTEADRISVDLCGRHGLWFDGSELQRLLRALDDMEDAASDAKPGFWKTLGERLLETDADYHRRTGRRR